MIKVKCISKNRNEKGVIANYTLQSESGMTNEFTAKEIKQAIINKRWKVTNLQIDKAGRLIDKAEPKIIPTTAINRAIHKLGQQILEGKNIQCTITNNLKYEERKVEFNIKVDPVLINFLETTEKEEQAIHYITNTLLKELEKEIYMLNVFGEIYNGCVINRIAYNIDKEKLYTDITEQEKNKLYKYYCKHYYKNNNSNDIETTYDFRKVNNKIKYIYMNPKELVKDFLSKLDERYGDNRDGYLFMADYNGTWPYQEFPMPPEVKKYFKSLIDCIVKQARESSIYVFDPYEDNISDAEFIRNSDFPDKVIKFMQTNKCNKGIVKGLAFLAAEEEGLAQISVVPRGLVDEGTEPILITANYDVAKKYIESSIENIKVWLTDGWDEEVSDKEFLDNIGTEGNELADKWFFRYSLEVDGRIIDDYQKVIINRALEHCVDYLTMNYNDILETVLWGTEAVPYMYLKYGIYRKDDDYRDAYRDALLNEVQNLKTILQQEIIKRLVAELKKPIKHYILKEQYRAASSEPLIGGVLYKGIKVECLEKLGTIASDTEINIDGKIIDIGEYIEKNNINTKELRLKYAWFFQIYEEI